MYFISTRGGEKVTGAQAIVQGLAKNGGLFVPENLPKLTKEQLIALSEKSYPDRAFDIFKLFLTDFTDEEIKDMSWTTFVAGCSHLPELVQYLKERRLYVNEPVTAEAEV